MFVVKKTGIKTLQGLGQPPDLACAISAADPKHPMLKTNVDLLCVLKPISIALDKLPKVRAALLLWKFGRPFNIYLSFWICWCHCLLPLPHKVAYNKTSVITTRELKSYK